MLTTVAAFREPWEAHMFRSRLEAEGVPAFVVHECHIGIAWHYSTALSGVKVQVSDERTADARAIEGLCRDGEFRSQLENEFGHMDEVHCPKCGSHDYWKRRAFFPAVMAVLLVFLFGVVLPPTGWVYFCGACGTKFRQRLYASEPGKWAMIWTAIAGELVLLFGLVLCAWAFGARYRLGVVLLVVLLVAPLIARWLLRLNNDGE